MKANKEKSPLKREAKKAPAPSIERPDPEEAKLRSKKFMAELEEKLKGVPDAELERGAKKIQDFIKGKVAWAELFNFTPEMLFQMAEYGFSQFQQGRYPEAERVFKVLTVLDWNNPYYHSVMGSILQRQKRYGEAIAEYTQAIEQDPDDIVSRVNRGEIFLQHGLLKESEEDLQLAIEQDVEGTNRFANRARKLMDEIRKFKEKKKG